MQKRNGYGLLSTKQNIKYYFLICRYPTHNVIHWSISPRTVTYVDVISNKKGLLWLGNSNALRVTVVHGSPLYTLHHPTFIHIATFQDQALRSGQRSVATRTIFNSDRPSAATHECTEFH